MKNIILKVNGMTCSACSNGLEKFLNKKNGIINANVNLVMSNVSINYDEKILNLKKIENYISQSGFESAGIFKTVTDEKENYINKKKIIVFSLLVIILLYISMGHMIKFIDVAIINPNENPIVYSMLLLFFTILFLLFGFDILKSGYKNLIHKMPNMDTLVSIGVISSFLYSLYGMCRILNGDYYFTNNLYFESSCIVIYFVKLGRHLDSINKDKTKEAIKKIVEITPEFAVIEVDNKEKKITLDEIKKGNVLICKPGEKIAVDGEIIEGKSHLDESFITGESKPVLKQKGNKVIAGSLNYDGYLKYKAEKIGKESTISQIVKIVLESSNAKMPIASLADKISSYFVPIIFVISVITLILYLLLGSDFSSALLTFITILVIACPCSLGLATPLAIVVSEGVCIKNGILIRKGEVLESSSKIDTIVFDKTGTLTYGKLKISKIYNYSNVSDDKLLQIIGSIESLSTHPISNAFLDYIKQNNVSKLKVNNFKSIQGYGIKGSVDNHNYILCNGKYLIENSILNMHKDDEQKLLSNKNSIIYVIKDKSIIALIGVNDIIRKNAKNVIQELNKNNIETIMLTGDNEEVANKIGEELKIQKIFSNILPVQKADVITNLKKKNKIVMMCGDGINDSPALKKSDIGVSFESATDIAIDSSDVILMKNDLSSILKLINISKETVRIIKQNLFWAFFYNILMIPIAAGVLKPMGISLNPILASIAMTLSSFIVILNSLRLRKK